MANRYMVTSMQYESEKYLDQLEYSSMNKKDLDSYNITRK